MVQLGLGKHVQRVSSADLVEFLKLLWIVYFFIVAGTSTARASALFFYGRVLIQGSSNFRYALWAVHGLNTAWYISNTLVITFICSPIQKSWNPDLPGTCINTKVLWLGCGTPTLIIDVLILLLPVPMLWRLHMKLVRKLLLVGVFLCGYLVIVVSIGRLISTIQVTPHLAKDPTLDDAVNPSIWVNLETPISIISICLPSIYFLVWHAYEGGIHSLFSRASSP
ncbi:uncharacterized protein BO97DRAFT_170054 [Aspergillus homomorphus CBS 101889]|uniref:Rhodopsin domain-containing protein n=1 Tax=Aspergillus homomorphus (strain CBS 101889) TaxID=1450537 RepID=A0A395HSM6_ASPHC|nr:hypothetical protein BO97DRAFT_170054 [Aspergillus homomorphus CBS 101889]RAL09234.1 hypothetical protein BO97DRAFT_170054 [Aspergillus homomorphus CBS 101889]